jgi:hypothetical protein
MESILRQQCEYVGNQVRASIRDMEEATWRARTTTSGMTPQETMSHLCDVYHYVAEKARGGKPEWGGYEGDGCLEDFDKLRAEAIDACLSAGDPVELLTDYIIVHDAYHVGQLCGTRIQAEPEWDPYAIYNM